MYNLIKYGLINPQSTCFQLRSAFFHSTPVLERGRRNCWNSNWHSEFDDDEQSSNKGPSFRRDNNGSRRNWTRGQGRQSRRRRGYNFCEDEEDDDDVEHVFRSAFGDRFFFWSFVHEDYPNWRNSSRHANGYRTSWKQRQRIEDEYDYESEDDSPKSNFASERIALGLSASGPLKLEDVKNAYRTCALKWHPDRHQGSSKAAAEEKFKLCTAAYQSLCDRLAVN